MSQAPKPTESPTQLMLVLEAGAGAAERLAAALRSAPIASVVVEPAGGRTLDAATAAPLVAAIQKANAAALISGDALLARTLTADGVHLPSGDTLDAVYGDARETLGNRFVVGIDAGASRHDAMSMGEAGAEYIGFGLPNVAATAAARMRESASEGQSKTAIEERLDLIAWWAEVFEVPCVAFDVTTTDEARALAEAGADFIAIRIAAAETPASTQDTVRAFSKAIASAERAGQG